MSEPNGGSVLHMQGIVKAYGGVTALNAVDFTLRGGEIHALLGANGAGKSTLMKILSGAEASDSGTISIDGRQIDLRDPADAKRAGIRCVYQEVDTSLVPHLTVAENIMLDKLASPSGSPLIRWRSLHEQASRIIERIGLKLSTRKQVRELSLSEKQLVLIARLLAEEAKFVILDEPTAPLSLEEAETLFRIMEGLKAEGIGVVFISHRLPEVFRISDSITVMRDGQRIWTKRTAETDMHDVVRGMLGRSFDEEYPKLPADIGAPVLSVSDLHAGTKVRGVSFEVRAGEIVAVVGLVGAGKSELSRVLFGADSADRGRVSVADQSANLRSPTAAIASGIVLVPEERRKEGILIHESLLHNLSLPILKSISRLGLLSGIAERAHATRKINELSIKAADVHQKLAHLSGGNQQKVAIGKWTATDARVFLFDEPTKGVDIGAKRDIFRLIGQLAQEGKAVLYLTCEFAEALGLADRILVMCDGQIVKSFDRGEATQEQLLYYASAGREDQL